MTLQEAADKLRKEIGTGTHEDAFVFNIGLAEAGENSRLVIYWRKKSAMKKCKLPEVYEGFKVESRYVGKIRLC